jgi:N-(2-amino-2-carboxyethyl)-L-glutamate synthase
MIVENMLDFEPPSIFARVKGFVQKDVNAYLKLEMFNPGGSIKFKTAVGMIRALELDGTLTPGKSIIETSSGNMAIALSLIARHRGYRFICVSDEKVTPHNRALIEAHEGEIIIIPKSTLNDRFVYIRNRMSSDDSLVWTRQFGSELNPQVHEKTTAREILEAFPGVNYLFVGAGTGGTLAGVGQALKKAGNSARLVAVDTDGSAHFAPVSPNARRMLPGIGASERSPFLDSIQIHEIVHVPEVDAVAACREFVHESGWLLGASSGSILAAIRKLQSLFRPGDVVIGIASDSGERYLDGLYNEEWVRDTFPQAGKKSDQHEEKAYLAD